MRKNLIAAFSLLALVIVAKAEPVCIGDTCFLNEEAAIAAGFTPEQIAAAKKAHAAEADDDVGSFSEPKSESPAAATNQPAAKVEAPVTAPAKPPRLLMGFRKSDELIAFLRNEQQSKGLEDHTLAMILLLVLMGGLAANLTPCVLPLVPVNLILVGKGWRRGAAYGSGIALAYGALGIAAALGGMAFGTIQSSPWFSAFVAVVFTVLAMAISGLVHIDLSRFRSKLGLGAKKPAQQPGAPRADPGIRSIWGVFLLGVGAAVLAGACVEPILLATLLLTAKWFAAGKVWAVVLPLVLGVGMGLPWPFAAAGLSVLPKPGAWMCWVNRMFACVFLAMAAWYGWLSWKGFAANSSEAVAADAKGAFVATPETWGKVFAEAKATGKPVFVDVWATWCKNCLAMEKTTFRDPAVVKELQRFAVVRLQAEKPEKFNALADFKSLDVKGFPAFIVFDGR